MADGIVSPPAGLSRELQIGKAAEHLVCADLILQGANAFLADAGLPYDVVADVDGRLYRVQVKSTRAPRPCRNGNMSYRFGTRRSKGCRPASAAMFDVVACVAFDLREIAYLASPLLARPNGDCAMCIEILSSAQRAEIGRIYSNGVRRTRFGRTFSDYASFFESVSGEVTARCRSCGMRKPLDAFCRNRRAARGLNSQCRSCVAEKAKAVA